MTAVPHDPADPQTPASETPGVQRGEVRWRRLPDGGVECLWRSPHDLMWGSVTMLTAFLCFDAFAVFFVARAGIAGVPYLVFCSYFTVLFAWAMVRNIRGRDLPSRLLATPEGGVRYWVRTNERPLHVPRAALADVSVEGVTRALYHRHWRLVVRATDRRRAHELFRAPCRSELQGTCRALRQGLRLDRPQAAASGS